MAIGGAPQNRQTFAASLSRRFVELASRTRVE
jgi:hypothetical protein